MRRLRGQDGFGVVELLVALTFMAIAIFALFAVFTAGSGALFRAGRVSAASVVAEKQMELYRAILNRSIGLNGGLVTSAAGDPLHTSDAVEWNGGVQVSPADGWCAASRPECTPIQTAVGPDGRDYRVDTYIRSETPSAGRPVKRVTVSVRRAENLTPNPLVKISSTFDLSTGCIYGSPSAGC